MSRKKSKFVKRKSITIRILVIFIAVAMATGIFMMVLIPMQANAAEPESLTVEFFETGKLDEALRTAADGTDYNFIKNVEVLHGTLSLNDYRALMSIPNITTLELAGCETEDREIPDNALESRNELRFVSLPQNTEVIGVKAFYNNKKLEKVNIPSTVREICDYAFEACEALSGISVSADLRYMGEGAFKDCKSLTEFDFPLSLTVIPPHAFSKCGFSEFSIHSDITEIGNGAFADCGSLRNIYAYGENAPSLSVYEAFRNLSATVHVYEDSSESYGEWETGNISVTGDLKGEYVPKSEISAAENLSSEVNATTTAISAVSVPETANGTNSTDSSEAVMTTTVSEVKSPLSSETVISAESLNHFGDEAQSAGVDYINPPEQDNSSNAPAIAGIVISFAAGLIIGSVIIRFIHSRKK